MKTVGVTNTNQTHIKKLVFLLKKCLIFTPLKTEKK